MEILSTILKIAFLKAKPQDLPYNIQLALIALLGCIATSILQASVTNLKVLPITFFIMQSLLFAVFLFLLLKASNKAPRYIQSATAFFAVLTLEQLIVYVFVMMPNAALFILIVQIWSFTARAHILRQALQNSLGASFFLLFAMTMLNYTVIVSLYFDILTPLIMPQAQ
ncbi:MAG: hypothetical protein ACRBHB_07240 [Arenicella sp.]